MNYQELVKTFCRRVQKRYGSNALAAQEADVSPAVWSNYCSSDVPEVNIHAWRFLSILNAAEREQLFDLLGRAQDRPACIVTEASEATEAAADLQRAVRAARADGELTPREKKELRGKALHLIAEAGDVVAALDEDAA